MNDKHTLCSLTPGQSAEVTGLCVTGEERRRLRELGFTDGARTECVLSRGNIDAFLIRGTVIGLRRSDSAAVLISRTDTQMFAERSCVPCL